MTGWLFNQHNPFPVFERSKCNKGQNKLSSSDWLTWQIIDSAFPSGSFAHSGGLEAAWQNGRVRHEKELLAFTEASLEQAAHSQLPFVVSARNDPDAFAELDRLCDAFLSNHVANRASRRQGATLLATCETVYQDSKLTELRSSVFENGLPCHLPPVFGLISNVLNIEGETALRMYLYCLIRGILSSAVRLGATGPLQAQIIQRKVAPLAEDIAGRSLTLDVKNLAQTSPLIEILQANQDRLYSRLFQS